MGSATYTVVGVDNAKNVVFTATVNEYVYGPAWSTSGITGLLFEYKIANSASSADAIDLVTVSTFSKATSGSLIAVDYDHTTGTPGTNPAPDTVQTTASNGVRFHFDTTSIMPGETSYVIYVQTSATVFDAGGNIALQNNGNGNAPSFEPGPEPSSFVLMGLMGLSFSGLGIRRWWRAGRSDERAK
jgi:hypothetical protein